MKSTLFLRPNFSSLSPLISSGVTEIRHMTLSGHVLRAEQFTLKSVSKEGHFILESETVFRPCLPCYCSRVTEIRHVALPAHMLRAWQFRLKSVSNEWHFTPQAEIVFCPYLQAHCSGVTEICHMHYLHMPYVQRKFR
jgi:hypothetical protein